MDLRLFYFDVVNLTHVFFLDIADTIKVLFFFSFFFLKMLDNYNSLYLWCRLKYKLRENIFLYFSQFCIYKVIDWLWCFYRHIDSLLYIMNCLVHVSFIHDG